MTTTRTTRRGATGLVEYWNETTRPLVSLIFVLPMLVGYEGGLFLFGPGTVLRNGADDWLRRSLQGIGLGQYFLLPLLTCAILLAWHHLTGERWRVRWTALTGMCLESVLYGFLLLVAARLQGSLVQSLTMQTAGLREAVQQAGGQAGQMIGFLGAGIYEELLFRLMLLPVLALLLRAVRLPPQTSWIMAMAISSLLFSAAHFELFVGSGEPFSTYRFVFRALAGGYFALLFLARGFGIAAAAHAFYDVLAWLSH